MEGRCEEGPSSGNSKSQMGATKPCAWNTVTLYAAVQPPHTKAIRDASQRLMRRRRSMAGTVVRSATAALLFQIGQRLRRRSKESKCHVTAESRGPRESGGPILLERSEESEGAIWLKRSNLGGNEDKSVNKNSTSKKKKELEGPKSAKIQRIKRPSESNVQRVRRFNSATQDKQKTGEVD